MVAPLQEPPAPALHRPDGVFDAVVVGGGIAGLSAAWELANAGLRVALLERDDRWGGKIVTDRLTFDDGDRTVTLVLDGGPESFITRKAAAWDLAGELGLQEAVQPAGSETRNIYVLDAGRPQPIPIGPSAFVRSTLISPRAKVRLLAEPLVPARRDMEDESLADFVSRRLGREALDKFIGPILGGIYNTDPAKQSILTTSPVMREMERDHGGLFVATLARARAKERRRKALAAQGQTLPPSFMAFAEGSGVLVDALVARLQEKDVTLRTGADVTALTCAETGWEVVLAGGERLAAAAVVLATPANSAAALIEPVDPKAGALLHSIRHASIGTISLVYRAAEFNLGFAFSGLMIQRSEHRAIDAITVTSERFRSRIPADYAVVRVFFGGSAPHAMLLDDAQLRAAVQGELRLLLGLTAQPLAWQIHRWPDAYPQAAVGHLDLVDRIEAALPAGLYVTGGAYRGLGVPDCVAQGRATAQQVAARVGQQ